MIGFFKSAFFWFALLGLLVLIGGIWGSWHFWGWLHPETSMEVSKSETLRNVGLLIGGLLAFVFAGWRALVAERQANAARNQAQTTEQGLLHERYQRGAEMLGNNILAVRLGGIYALTRLAGEYPEQYHIPVIELLSAFARNPVGPEDELEIGYPGIEPITRLREDLQAVMVTIGNRGDRQLMLEQESGYVPNLTGAFLCYLQLEKGNLSGVRLSRADLRGAYLFGANLSKASLDVADMSGATLAFADLSGSSLIFANLSLSKMPCADLSKASLDSATLSEADLNSANLLDATFYGANLSGTDFSHNGQGPAIGLTQFQLDCAYRTTEGPPVVARVIDTDTAKPLVWRRPDGFID